jgi:hypothetical protein
MESYLCVGGNHDGLNYPASAATPERLQMQVGITGKEVYKSMTLSLGDVSVTVYIHESLAPAQALNLLVEY